MNLFPSDLDPFYWSKAWTALVWMHPDLKKHLVFSCVLFMWTVKEHFLVLIVWIFHCKGNK
jgi:hypothetical protein